MTTIAGVEVSVTQCVLAGDTMVSSESITDRVPSKICRFDNFAIGVAGLVSHVQRIRYGLRLKGPAIDDGIEEWVVTMLVPSLEQLIEKGDWEAIVGVRGQIWTISGECLSAVRTFRGFAAIGDGAQVALGALASDRFATDPTERVQHAIRVASMFFEGSTSPESEVVWV